MRRLLCLAIIALLPRFYASGLETSAQSAVLIEESTGTVLYEHNADSRRLIASTTKIMTGLLAVELLDLDMKVTVPDGAVGVEGSSMYLQYGQELTVRELVNGLMLQSGNDAAHALAVICSGSIEKFAETMNKRAMEIGMKNTRFANPHGLNAPEHYSTARDMGLLASEAMKNDMFRAVVSSKYAKVGEITVKNHNKMLWIYNGADGVKTGYTIDAGRCLVSSAERDGMRLIAVTLNDRDDWDDHADMLDYGFANYSLLRVCEKGQEMAKCSVFAGEYGTMSLIAPEDFNILLPRGEKVEIKITRPAYLWAEVYGGFEAGAVRVMSSGKTLASMPLLTARYCAEQKTEPQGIWERFLSRFS